MCSVVFHGSILYTKIMGPGEFFSGGNLILKFDVLREKPYFFSMKQSQKRGMVFGSFAADSLALGSHWVYNAKAIAKRLGSPDRLTDPIVKKFHPTKRKGDFTHYGDQAFRLLRFIADTGGYDGAAFFRDWTTMMADYDGYFDHATKETLAHGGASDSDDLAGAGRSAPILYLFSEDPERAVEEAVAHAALTHGNPIVFDTVRFFSGLVFELTSGEIGDGSNAAGDKSGVMERAISTVLGTYRWESEEFPEKVEKGVKSKDRDTTEVIGEFGQMCEAPRAFPSTVHLLAKYPDNYRKAMVANTAAGGDSAARGLLAGMVLGALLGEEAIPEEWRNGLTVRREINEALRKVDNIG